MLIGVLELLEGGMPLVVPENWRGMDLLLDDLRVFLAVELPPFVWGPLGGRVLETGDTSLAIDAKSCVAGLKGVLLGFKFAICFFDEYVCSRFLASYVKSI